MANVAGAVAGNLANFRADVDTPALPRITSRPMSLHS